MKLTFEEILQHINDEGTRLLNARTPLAGRQKDAEDLFKLMLETDSALRFLAVRLSEQQTNVAMLIGRLQLEAELAKGPRHVH